MKHILLSMVLIALVFTGCNKISEGDQTKKDLEITLSTSESYHFNEKPVSVIKMPKNFVAVINDNEVKGIHQGVTDLVVKAGNVTYNCKIKVDAAHTFYTDMAMYLGHSKANIVKLYGEPILSDGNTGLFAPLMPSPSEINNLFGFDENDKVVACVIYFSISDRVNVINHLNDRYITYVPQKYTTLMGDADNIDNADVLVLYNCGALPISVTYTTQAYLNQQSARSKSSADNLEDLSERMKTLILER